MKTIPDPTDTGMTLGAPVRQPQAAATPTKTTTPGVYRGTDGKAFTDLPMPSVPVAPVVHVEDGDLCEFGSLPPNPWQAELLDLQREFDEEMRKVLPKAAE